MGTDYTKIYAPAAESCPEKCSFAENRGGGSKLLRERMLRAGHRHGLAWDLRRIAASQTRPAGVSLTNRDCIVLSGTTEGTRVGDSYPIRSVSNLPDAISLTCLGPALLPHESI
jgi:hypothetical protein